LTTITTISLSTTTTTTTTSSLLLQVQGWTTTTTISTSLLSRRRAGQISSASSTTTTTTTTTTTALFGKKKKKDTTKSSSTVTKMQVKLLQHIAGTGQAGDIIMVNPIFFDNKLRPQKLARIITDDEVQKDIESNQEDQKQLMDDANAIKDLLGSKEEKEKSKDSDKSDYTLSFLDNQTGPDGNKLFGGIGPKKILDALKLDCKKFDVFSKEHTKLVSIIDVQEEKEDEKEEEEVDDDADKPKFKSWDDDDNDNDNNDNPSITFKSLPKSDKLTIKRTGQYRLKVSLTKEINVMIRVIVE
jgi:ribosomal protein L9